MSHNTPKPVLKILLICFIVAITEVYKNDGNDEYGKRNFRNAINFYTEGIKVNCKDEELKAKLYCNRAAAHFRLGERFYFNFLIYSAFMNPDQFSFLCSCFSICVFLLVENEATC